MATIDASGFRQIILSVESGERLLTALHATYNKTLEELWGGFLHNVQEMI